jgi:aminomethyltransferase
MKRTPFFAKHVANGGRIVPFAGYEMPVQFRGIIPEHTRVRTTVGVFDVAHMGRVEIRGKDAFKFTNHVTTNDVNACAFLQAQYSIFCYPDGGIVDDLLVYNLGDYALLVINGANHDKDVKWLKDNLQGDVQLIDVTDPMAQLAIQGPKSEAVMQKLTDIKLADIKFYWSNWCTLAGTRTLISRTGYTGEDGFEIYFPAPDAAKVWDAVMAAGKEYEIEPIGLGARDTLRLEMKYSLYGNDIDQTTNPLEAVLGWVTKLDKPDGFVGSDALKRVKAEGVKRKLIGFEMDGNDIPRPHYDIILKGAKVGHVTSGTMSPSLKKGIGLGYVQVPHTATGTELEIAIRGRNAPATVVTTPFYKQGTRR